MVLEVVVKVDLVEVLILRIFFLFLLGNKDYLVDEVGGEDGEIYFSKRLLLVIILKCKLVLFFLKWLKE